VSEFCVGTIANVNFDRLPSALVVAYPLAGSADGQQAAQCFDLTQRLLKLDNQAFSLPLRLLALRDVVSHQADHRPRLARYQGGADIDIDQGTALPDEAPFAKSGLLVLQNH
jgi:hypothetical protein